MMETINLIQTLIGNLGFPIVMVLYFIWDKYKTMTPLIEAINNNTMAINKLMILIDREDLLEESNEK